MGTFPLVGVTLAILAYVGGLRGEAYSLTLALLTIVVIFGVAQSLKRSLTKTIRRELDGFRAKVPGDTKQHLKELYEIRRAVQAAECRDEELKQVLMRRTTALRERAKGIRGAVAQQARTLEVVQESFEKRSNALDPNQERRDLISASVPAFDRKAGQSGRAAAYVPPDPNLQERLSVYLNGGSWPDRDQSVEGAKRVLAVGTAGLREFLESEGYDVIDVGPNSYKEDIAAGAAAFAVVEDRALSEGPWHGAASAVRMEQFQSLQTFLNANAALETTSYYLDTGEVPDVFTESLKTAAGMNVCGGALDEEWAEGVSLQPYETLRRYVAQRKDS
ncbi:hypothetical protein [Nesterenkonia populi]